MIQNSQEQVIEQKVDLLRREPCRVSSAQLLRGFLLVVLSTCGAAKGAHILETPDSILLRFTCGEVKSMSVSCTYYTF